MSEALGNLLERRSIRAYKPEQISEDELQSVLKAGLLAPSAMNRQPTAMLVVQDKDTIALLSKLNAKVMGKAGIGDEYIGIGHCILGYVCGDKPAAHPTRDGRVFRI